MLQWALRPVLRLQCGRARYNRSTLVVETLFIALAVAAAAPAASHEQAPRIVVLGDSLTSGRGIGIDQAFPAVLQQQLDVAGYEYQVINAGVSGDTSARALRRFKSVLEGDVRVLIVALGANDGLRGVSVQQLKSNLSQIIEEAQRRAISVLLCGMEAPPMRGWDYSASFHSAYDELATRYRVPLVPFPLLELFANPALMQRDRIHPNEAGARAIARQIWPYLKALLKQAA
jgi:acyl-CoA thioesterase I